MLAGFCQAFDNLLRDARVELAHGQVVHEEERGRALHGNVIHAVVHQVGADSVVDTHLESQLQLGPHAIHTGDENRIEVLSLVHSEEPAEAADLAQNAFGEGFMRKVLDPLLGAVSLIDIYARIRVSDGFG